MWIQISAGKGPEECALAVGLFYKSIQQELIREGFQVESIDCVKGDHSEAYQSVLLSVQDSNHIERIKALAGTILWVCKSPYRPMHKRKNWFINVEVFEEKKDLKLKESEIKVETMRSSGNGGQNVNKVESAVRVTHIPTGIVAIAREERSQLANKKLALARMMKNIESMNQCKSMELKDEMWNQHNELQRGNPIRTYSGMDFKRMK